MNGAAAIEEGALETARLSFQEACAHAATATADGRFDRAAAYLNIAAMHFAELSRLRGAVESMAKGGAR